MNTRRDLLLAGMAALAASACSTPRDAAPVALDVPGATASDWSVASPSDHAIDDAALDAVLADAATLPAMRALLVVRHGRLVAERYYGGVGAGDLLPINSVTKSVASMLVGQALARGLLPGLDATVGSLLPEAAARVPDSVAARATLRQVLTGHTGLDANWPAQRASLARSRDPLGAVLALPADPAGPGPWRYNNAAVGLLSPILTRAHSRPLVEVAARELFAPLGIARFAWARDATGAVTTHAGLQLTARDLARLTWAMADGGRWGAAQVLPPAWVVDSTRTHGPTDWRVQPVSDPGYGYLWFTGKLHRHSVAWGWGFGAQFALLVPALRLAIVTAAQAPARPEALIPQNNAVMALVARVVRATA